MSSEVISTNLQDWRMKAQAGTLTSEESKHILSLIRRERVGSSEVSAASREKKATATPAAKRAKAAPVDSSALLAAFMSKPT